MMGIDPERAAAFMEEHGADIVALNCGTGMDMERARQAVIRYKATTSLPVMAQPNAGLPKLIDLKVVYDETPEQMVRGVLPLLDSGVNILGGCCGSAPDHIRAFRRAIACMPDAKGSLVSQPLCQVNAAAVEKLPQPATSPSAHYIDAYLKPMNAKLPDGTPVKCKRRGRDHAVGGAEEGRGLMRRLVSPDPVAMLDAALQEAAAAARAADGRGGAILITQAAAS
jgi:hypothetical protein